METLSLTDRVTEILRNKILDLSLTPGTQLDEKMLQSQFDFGRTPMREALGRLVSEGLVEARASRGLRVTPFSLVNTLELVDAYILCERMVSYNLRMFDDGLVDDLLEIDQAYLKSSLNAELLEITQQNALFHARLALATRNKYIIEYSTKLHNLGRRLSFYIYEEEDALPDKLQGLFDRTRGDHSSIIRCIRDQDRDGLVANMTDHAKLFQERLGALLNLEKKFEFDFSLKK